MTLDDLRRFAVARSLFPPTTLGRAVERLGFVQADPIRAPARAQDLTLRHRVRDYRAGDLERRYRALAVEEDVFINYGFVSARLHALMHPRRGRAAWSRTQKARAEAVLAFVRERGAVHPRDVDSRFAHGTVTNYWGGSSNATTHLMDAMHYRGLLRVARREAGIRVYSVREPGEDVTSSVERERRLDALVDAVVAIYAPLPSSSLSMVISRLRYAVPQWRGGLKAALQRARRRLGQARVEGTDWYWPAAERPSPAAAPEVVRFLAPFDPVVWDRRRFESLWGWAYRFEAYTPKATRTRGYYALPLLWRDRMIGWSNLSVIAGRLQHDIGYIDARPPRDRRFALELEAELERVRLFLTPHRPGRDPMALSSRP